jgi:hypothetical protein
MQRKWPLPSPDHLTSLTSQNSTFSFMSLACLWINLCCCCPLTTSDSFCFQQIWFVVNEVGADTFLAFSLCLLPPHSLQTKSAFKCSLLLYSLHQDWSLAAQPQRRQSFKTLWVLGQHTNMSPEEGLAPWGQTGRRKGKEWQGEECASRMPLQSNNVSDCV